MDLNWMDGDARPPSKRTVAREASTINRNQDAKQDNEDKSKQVKLNEIQKSKLKKHFTALKENRNRRERQHKNNTNEDQTEQEEKLRKQYGIN